MLSLQIIWDKPDGQVFFYVHGWDLDIRYGNYRIPINKDLSYRLQMIVMSADSLMHSLYFAN